MGHIPVLQDYIAFLMSQNVDYKMFTMR